MFVRGHRIEAWSSAEAAFYGAVMGISEAFHIQQMLASLAKARWVEVFTDIAAARSTFWDQGGKSPTLAS